MFNGCPSEKDLMEYLEQISQDEGSTSEHIDECEICQAKIDELAHDSELHKSNVLLQQKYARVADHHQAHLEGLKEIGRFEFRGLEVFERPIGYGAMGIVFKAYHPKLRRNVAIKVLRPDCTYGRQAIERFFREIEIVGALSHPNVVHAFDAGASGSLHFLVTEFVDGPSLAELIDRHGRLPVSVACEVALNLVNALSHIHSNQIIHRDIKPSNVLLSRGGTIKLADLGLSCLEDRCLARDALTSSGMVMGTADYLSPEQAAGGELVGTAADYYGLGCTIYHCLTRRVPFDSPRYNTIQKKLVGHLNNSPPPLQNFREDVPIELNDLLFRLLRKSAADRENDPVQISSVLRKWASQEDLVALICTRTSFFGFAQSSIPPVVADVVSSLKNDASTKPRFRRMLAILSITVAIAAAAILAASYQHKIRPGEEQIIASIPEHFRDLAHNELQPKKWYPLLNVPPEKYLWEEEGSRSWVFNADTSREQFFVSTYGPSILLLGEVQSDNYSVQLDISQTTPDAGIGIFLGLHPTSHRTWTFQTIEFASRSGQADAERFPLALCRNQYLLETEEGGETLMHPRCITSVPVEAPTLRAKTLLIVVEGSKITNVRWDSDSDNLRPLWSAAATKQLNELTAADHRGKFGIYCNYSTAMIEQARIKVH